MRGQRVGFLAVLIGLGCSSKSNEVTPPTAKEPPCKVAAGAFAPLSTRCGQFVDLEGRVVVLRGINARIAEVFDEDLGPGKVPLETLPKLDAADFPRMRRIGFDVLRLPVHWSALEPNDASPPVYDAAYLERIAALVAAAKAADVRVLLDLHQDAYSKYIGQDGAPLWAIVPAPTKLLEGPLTDLGTRTLSKQVLAAFDTFFSATAPDGPRLRKRFGAAAATLAKRFVGESAIIGIDLFNEPNATDERARAFDEEVGAAIRAVDPARLLFLEPPATRNLLDHASLATSAFPLGGIVYAPHVYTHVFTPDDGWKATFTLEDLRPSNASARDEADSWGAPLFIGEFGFGPSEPRFGDYVGGQLQLQDEYMASSTFWLWKEASEGAWGFYDFDPATSSFGKERATPRKVFARVQPRAIAGWPVRWSFDPKSVHFELATIGDPNVKAPTVLHTPTPEDAPAGYRVTCDGKEIDAAPDAKGDMTIQCNGAGEHLLVVVAK